MRRFLDALRAEGATDADRPGSICPLGTHPLFQRAGGLLPCHTGHQGPSTGELPTADAAYATTVMMPVRHRKGDVRLADACTAVIIEVVTHAKGLM